MFDLIIVFCENVLRCFLCFRLSAFGPCLLGFRKIGVSLPLFWSPGRECSACEIVSLFVLWYFSLGLLHHLIDVTVFDDDLL